MHAVNQLQPKSVTLSRLRGLLLARIHIGDQNSNGRRLSSSVVVCNTRITRVTHQGAARDGGPVVLRLVRATACFLTFRRDLDRRSLSFSERTTLRSLYAISRSSVVCCLSVVCLSVCDVGAPYSGG